MPDTENPLEPPETPPGEPGSESTENTENKPQVAAAPTFTREQVSDLVRESVRGVITELTPKPPIVNDAPSGPDPAQLTTQIDQLDAEIDAAVQDGKPIRELQRKRDQLRDQKFEAEHVAPLRTQGAQAINDVVLTQMRADADLGELFKEYESEVRELLVKGLRPGQPIQLEWVKDATRMVAGRHLTEIRQREREAAIRQSKDAPAPLPGGSNGRTLRTTTDKQPETIREQFGERAEEAFQFKRRKGHTEDTFARTQGFQNKAEWFKRDRELAENPTLNLDK